MPTAGCISFHVGAKASDGPGSRDIIIAFVARCARAQRARGSKIDTAWSESPGLMKGIPVKFSGLP